MSEQCAVGIDWCNGAWLAVIYRHEDVVDVLVEEDISEIIENYGQSSKRIIVDIPIGLFEEGDREEGDELVRECDRLARRVLGARHSSVFNPPAKEVARLIDRGTSHSEASEENRRITGKGLQKQAYYIAEGIYQVDVLLDEAEENDDILDTIAEAHPEVCFTALAGGGMAHSKKTIQGVVERIEAMSLSEDESWMKFKVVSEMLGNETDRDIDVDDVIDAIVLAYTASAPDGELQSLPPNGSEVHFGTQDHYRRMEMVYRATEPLPQVKEMPGSR